MSVNYDSMIWCDFLDRNHLSKIYLDDAEKCYLPLIEYLSHCANASSNPILVALNGCQGSGKSTLADYLATYLSDNFGTVVETISLDDFYLGHESRGELSRDIHPLLATRGVPGTHDITFLNETLDRLIDKRKATGTLIPRFDKSTDDRKPKAQWSVVVRKPDIIFLEGWCLGAEPADNACLIEPINELERSEDRELTWRTYVNEQLKCRYMPIYSRFDIWIMLKAPSFESVFSWRLEQEQKLGLSKRAGSGFLMNDTQILRFIQHFERITVGCLASLPEKVDFLYALDQNRSVLETTYSQRIWESRGVVDN